MYTASKACNSSHRKAYETHKGHKSFYLHRENKKWEDSILHPLRFEAITGLLLTTYTRGPVCMHI